MTVTRAINTKRVDTPVQLPPSVGIIVDVLLDGSKGLVVDIAVGAAVVVDAAVGAAVVVDAAVDGVVVVKDMSK